MPTQTLLTKANVNNNYYNGKLVPKAVDINKTVTDIVNTKTNIAVTAATAMSTLAVSAATGASVSATTMTIGGVDYGAFAAGQIITGTGIAVNTYITSGSGTTWTVTPSTSATGTITITASGYVIPFNAKFTRLPDYTMTTAGFSFIAPTAGVIGASTTIKIAALTGTAPNFIGLKRLGAAGTWTTGTTNLVTFYWDGSEVTYRIDAVTTT